MDPEEQYAQPNEGQGPLLTPEMMQPPQGMQQPQQQMPQYGGPGRNPAPLPQMNGEMSLLYAKSIAKDGAVQLQELDRAAKFRRALSMIQETFAEITGRPDIAAKVRQRIVEEDHERAAQVESQILARVGRQALEEERIAAEAKQQQFAHASQMDQLKMQAQAATKNVDDFKALTIKMPQAPAAELMDAIGKANQGDAASLAALRDKYYDEGAEERANSLAQNTGAAADAKVQLAGRESATRTAASASVEASPKVTTAKEEAAARERKAKFDFENDPANVATRARTEKALGKDKKNEDATLAKETLLDVERSMKSAPDAAADVLIRSLESVQRGIRIPDGDLLRLQNRLSTMEAEIQADLKIALETSAPGDPRVQSLKKALAKVRAAK